MDFDGPNGEFRLERHGRRRFVRPNGGTRSPVNRRRVDGLLREISSLTRHRARLPRRPTRAAPDATLDVWVAVASGRRVRLRIERLADSDRCLVQIGVGAARREVRERAVRRLLRAEAADLLKGGP